MNPQIDRAEAVRRITNNIDVTLSRARTLQQETSDAKAASYLKAWSEGLNQALVRGKYPKAMNIVELSAIADAAMQLSLDIRQGKPVSWSTFPRPSIN